MKPIARKAKNAAMIALMAGMLTLTPAKGFGQMLPLNDTKNTQVTISKIEEPKLDNRTANSRMVDSALTMISPIQKEISNMKDYLKHYGWPSGGPGSSAAREYYRSLEEIEKDLEAVRLTLPPYPEIGFEHAKRIQVHFRDCRREFYLAEYPMTYWKKYAKEDGVDSAYASQMFEKTSQEYKILGDWVFGGLVAVTAAMITFLAFATRKRKDT